MTRITPRVAPAPASWLRLTVHSTGRPRRFTAAEVTCAGQRLAVGGMAGRQRAGPGQDLRQHRRTASADMQDDEDSRREVRRQPGHERSQRGNPRRLTPRRRPQPGEAGLSGERSYYRLPGRRSVRGPVR